MYNSLKKAILNIVSKEFLLKNELFFRSFYGFFYKGKKHQCNICSNKLSSFILMKNEDLMCPFCGSLSRNRRLWNLIKNKYLKGNVLHFSPSRSLYRTLKNNKNITYYSSDFENEFLADYKFNITEISQPNTTFDLVICYHILEHITDDKKAMEELYRILKPNGIIYIQTPFKTGGIYEDYSIISPEDRLKHFGQEDHVRVYSANGLKERLENIGFKVNVENFNEDFHYGLKPQETVLILNK